MTNKIIPTKTVGIDIELEEEDLPGDIVRITVKAKDEQGGGDTLPGGIVMTVTGSEFKYDDHDKTPQESHKATPMEVTWSFMWKANATVTRWADVKWSGTPGSAVVKVTATRDGHTSTVTGTITRP